MAVLRHRARLIATDKGKAETSSRWAHDVPKPEKGCLLLAHPLMFGNTQSYFSQVSFHLHQKIQATKTVGGHGHIYFDLTSIPVSLSIW